MVAVDCSLGQNQNQRVGLPGKVLYFRGCLSFLALLNQYGEEIITWDLRYNCGSKNNEEYP